MLSLRATQLRPALALRPGDLVVVAGERRRYVVLPVTRRDLMRGYNARRPGLHFFGGYWYEGGPTRKTAFGKLLDPVYCRVLRRVARRVRHFAAARHCR